MTDVTLISMGNGDLRGHTQDDDRAWKRFKGWLKTLGRGELVDLTWKRRRNPKFHRKFFALLKLGFDSWDPPAACPTWSSPGMLVQKSFEAFRKEITILAGYCTAVYRLDGTFTLEADSISFGEMDQDRFERLYESVVDVLIKHVLMNYTRPDVDRVVAELERFNDERG